MCNSAMYGPIFPRRCSTSCISGWARALHVRIYHNEKLQVETVAPYQRTFGEVPIGKPLVYINSLLNLAVALNQRSYAAAHQIESGPDWFIEISPD